MAYSTSDLTADLSSLNHIDALLKGQPRWWLNNLGTENVIRFAFPTANAEQAYYGTGPSGYQPFNTVQKDSTRQALKLMTGITGVNFQEVSDPNGADLFFGQASMGAAGLNRARWSYGSSGGTLTKYRIRSLVAQA